MAKSAIQLIEEAIEAEKAAKDRYDKGAQEAGDPETRALFKQLADWEEGHEKMLTDRLSTLKMLGHD